MKMASVAMVFVLAICLAVVSACDGGDADITARDISDEELALMVLPQQELGREYAELQLDEETSGFVTNEEAIKKAYDPDDERQDIELFGRVNGYAGTYSSGEGLWVGEEALDVATVVEVLRDSAGASGRLEDEIADYEVEFPAQAEEQEAEEVHLLAFSPGDVGDEAFGLQMRGTFPLDGGWTVSYDGFHVAFRRGRLVGVVVVGQFDGEFDEKERRDKIVALARKLDERIQAVLRGGITPTPPATLPTLAEEASPTPIPWDVIEDFAALAGKWVSTPAMVRYELTDDETAATASVILYWHSLDAWRVDFSGEDVGCWTYGMLEGEGSVLLNKETIYQCSVTGTDGACWPTDVVWPEQIPPYWGTLPLPHPSFSDSIWDLAPVVGVDRSTRVVAGERAVCFAMGVISAKVAQQPKNETCFAHDGIVLSQFSERSGGWRSGWEATEVIRQVSDVDLEPPYPVTEAEPSPQMAP